MKGNIKNKILSLIGTKRGEVVIFTFFIIIVSFVYSDILFYKYTGSDFFAQVAGNSNIKDALAAPLSERFLGDSWYRPVDAFSIYLNYAIGGLDPFIYQFTNFIIFIIAIVLVYLLVRQIFSDKKLAFASSFVFSFYPLCMIIVPVVDLRAEMLLTVFMVLTIILLDRYLKTGNKLWQILAVIAGFLTICSKEIGIVMMPLLVTFYIILRKKDQILNLKKLIYNVSPFIADIVFFFILVALLLGKYAAMGFSSLGRGPSTFVINRMNASVEFFGSMIYPIDVLGLDKYNIMKLNGEDISILYIFAAFVSLVIILYFILYLFKKKIKIRQFFDIQYLKNYFTIENFLLFWILSYFAFFVAYGKFAWYYAFLIMVPVSILIPLWFFKLGNSKKDKLKKTIIVIFVVYCLVASPTFTSYSNYKTGATVIGSLIPDIINSTQNIPNNISIYVVTIYDGVLGNGISAGISTYSLAGLFYLVYPDKHWRVIPIGQFVIVNADKSYSVNYTLEKIDSKIKFELEGKNIFFYKYPGSNRSFHGLPIRENVYVSGEEYPHGSINQTVIIEKYNLSDYVLICNAKDSRVYANIISVGDIN